MDAAARLGRRDALHLVHAALELEPAVGAVAAHLDDGLLDAIDAGLVQAEHLRLEAVAVRVARVHTEDLGGEQRRLVATRPCADLEDHVAIVVRVAWQQQDAQLLQQPALLALEVRDLVAGHLAEIVIAFAHVSHLARAASSRRTSATERLHGRLESRELTTESADLVRIGAHLGPRQLRLEIVVLPGDLRELRVEIAWRDRGRLVRVAVATGPARRAVSSSLGSTSGSRSKTVEPAGIGLPSEASASSIEQIATRSCRRSAASS